MNMRKDGDQRLRGWKSIAAYMSVTESTAIRWSKRPGFPVVRSSDKGSVYALPSAIDAWIASTKGLQEQQALSEPVDRPDETVAVAQAATSTGTRRFLIAGAAALGAGVIGLAIARLRPRQRNAGIRDPELEALYIDARSDAAARTPDSLDRATSKFQDIIARYPNFAPGFTGLADSYILSCEFGSTDRAVAFQKARAAVSTALAIAPEDADANRIMGFLTYWTTRDIAPSRPFFKSALQSQDADHLIHLWFGNALIDAGELAGGLKQLRQAIVLAPDSPSVLTDYAIALWQAGQSQVSMSSLMDVEMRFPTHSGAPNAAALFQLQAGNIAAYLDQSRRWTTLINDERQAARVTAEAAVFAAEGSHAALAFIARSTPIVSSFWHGGELPVAMAASMKGNRERVRMILNAVAERGDTWRNLRFPAESFLRWKDDAELRGLLRRVLDPADFPDFPKG